MSRGAIILGLALLWPGEEGRGQTSTQAVTVPSSLLQALHYRMVCPHRGGRVTAVTGYPARPHDFLMGTVGGGIWRTDDARISWENVSDGYLGVGPVGALAVAPTTEGPRSSM